MGRTEDLAKLDRTVKDAEIRIRTVSTAIDGLDKEIETLSSLEDQLVQNVKCLKKSKIIAIAVEFKKAKEDLKKTRTRMTALQNDRTAYQKSKNEAQSNLEKAKEDMGKLQKSNDNVLQGKFGRKNGR